MAVTIQIRPNERQMAELRRAFERLSSVGRDPRPVLGRIGLYVRREAQRRLRGREKSWGPSTGKLAQSLAISLDAASVTVGSNMVYAAIQQLGGDVHPRGVYLAIPVLPHLRRRGVWPRDLPGDSMRFNPAAEISIGGHTWRGPALERATDQTRRSPTATEPGRVVVVRPRGEVMFALVRRVRIQARPYLVFDEAAQAFALAQLAMEYRRAARGG